MSVLRITGGRALRGSVRVHGAKNSVLPIFAACLVARGVTVIHNCPNIADVDAAMQILIHLGCKAERDGDTVTVDTSTMTNAEVPHSLMQEMRSSVIFLGSILGRCGEASISTPGGCELGPRPIDMHLAALRQLGAEITDNGGSLVCRANRLRGAKITLRSPSVGATENAILAACFAEGTTVISNAAREPEISDLQRYLRALGITVLGAGTPTIVVEGRLVRVDTAHRVIPDRIVAVTYLCAAAATGGEITLTDVNPAHFTTVTDALTNMGCAITRTGDSVTLSASGRLYALEPVMTEPYPGFPTDAQAGLMAACLRAQGTTSFIENIFDNRYRHADEMRRFGANIKLEGRVALVTGVKSLKAAPVKSPDLRGGAALVIAALSAEGTSEVSDIHHIDRGYDDLAGALTQLGAEIVRIDS
ncbi:MAG: UDP-N-acetylglucosamine 1-carboxyvinyltransferase [Oscillospiraceae bacterium]|nr:UDP-N-acetylglucosamine 1-carboxyvinyltransferase [Oscillospiraceae bacterium]